MRTEQEIRNRLDSLYIDYGFAENRLINLKNPSKEQFYSEVSGRILDEINTLEWILNDKL